MKLIALSLLTLALLAGCQNTTPPELADDSPIEPAVVDVAADPTPAPDAELAPGVDLMQDLAENAYGDRSKWTLIRDANPDMDWDFPDPDMPLIIPIERKAVAEPTPAPETLAEPAAPAANIIYAVSADDTAGYWGIAKKCYGEGKYHTLISEANPNVDSRALRVGQQLVIPPMPNGTASAQSGPATPPVPGG